MFPRLYGAPIAKPEVVGAQTGVAAPREQEQPVRVTGNSDFIVGEKARNEASFLPGVMLSERSSPSRVRFAAPKDGAPLTAAGRSEPAPPWKERGETEKAPRHT